MLHNIRIVLIETSHTGNIGSTARAMKTMGLTNLYLVNSPIKFDSQSSALAAGASDVIACATFVDTIDDAIKDCKLVIGTSTRTRMLPWPMLESRACGMQAVRASALAPVALVFGRERIGLTNHELQKCHYHVEIPANPDYSSLNLAMAVQIIAYEVRMAYLDHQTSKRVQQKEEPYPLTSDLEYFYQHLEKTLKHIGFIRPNHPGQVMNRLRCLFTRARLNEHELHILRGMLTSIDQQNR
ncbi:tRNA (cytosine(32)/uridine(32)-2'-O)-methyltransferase TrmJ [Candidatus Gillettellia adelgis]